MRTYLLPKDGSFYKANLHGHTTVSDGKNEPEETKASYMAKGYSIIAFTDHNLFIPHDDLAEEGFLPLNGVELDVTAAKGEDPLRTATFHLCCIALEPDTVETPYFITEKYGASAEKYGEKFRADAQTRETTRIYSPEFINTMMKTLREKGFFLTYNHPTWSYESIDSIRQYEGMDAMEIYNQGCWALGYEEYNPQIYDALLRQGKRIYCLATDDNHNNPSRSDDSFGGWTMIKASKLEYRTVTQALQDGHFYASTGPEIKELWLEDSTLHITCSPVEKILLTTAHHRGELKAATVAHLTEAEFKLQQEDTYVRVTIFDQNGKVACTNAYFLDTI